MTRRYYSSRNKPRSLTLEELYSKLQNLFLLFCGRGYFEKVAITDTFVPSEIKHQAALDLTFQPFPITDWGYTATEDRVFDTLEYLYDFVSKPGDWVTKYSEGDEYSVRSGFDDQTGREEFRKQANAFLAEYKDGYELTEQGIVLALGRDGLQHILDAEIIPYDEVNVDSKVRDAITKWRNRHLSPSEKKAAIRELADVFEWLKKTRGLSKVLDTKDESAIFDLANNFAIRHHNPDQKKNYDSAIWYSWMFHFYLATYHAAIRLLIKKEQKQERAPEL